VDATIITIIFTAFGALLGAVFAGVLKLLRELRKILNGNSEQRSVMAAVRHEENVATLNSVSKSMDELKATMGNHCSEQTTLLRKIASRLQKDH